jgi:hypothetical protein
MSPERTAAKARPIPMRPGFQTSIAIERMTRPDPKEMTAARKPSSSASAS